jgi:hypothetical protein
MLHLQFTPSNALPIEDCLCNGIVENMWNSFVFNILVSLSSPHISFCFNQAGKPQNLTCLHKTLLNWNWPLLAWRTCRKWSRIVSIFKSALPRCLSVKVSEGTRKRGGGYFLNQFSLLSFRYFTTPEVNGLASWVACFSVPHEVNLSVVRWESSQAFYCFCSVEPTVLVSCAFQCCCKLWQCAWPKLMRVCDIIYTTPLIEGRVDWWIHAVAIWGGGVQQIKNKNHVRESVNDKCRDGQNIMVY